MQRFRKKGFKPEKNKRITEITDVASDVEKFFKDHIFKEDIKIALSHFTKGKYGAANSYNRIYKNFKNDILNYVTCSDKVIAYHIGVYSTNHGEVVIAYYKNDAEEKTFMQLLEKFSFS